MWASQVTLVVKNPPASTGDPRDRGSIPGKIFWSRKWQPPPVFLPGESHDLNKSVKEIFPFGEVVLIRSIP